MADPIAPDARRSREDRAALIAKLEDEKRRTSICGLERVWPALTEAEADLLLAALRDGPAETPAPQQLDMLPSTYPDGIKAERCLTCGRPLRNASGENVVTICQDDAEEIACILEEYVDCPEVWGDTIKRLEQACGRTVAQMRKAALAVSHPAGADEPDE